MTSRNQKPLADISYALDDDELFETSNDDEPDELKPEATAFYIRDMVQELSSLARHSGLDVLAYLLEMAKAEAHAQGTRGNNGSDTL